MEILKVMRLIISIPKTIYFNFRYLPIKQAIKLPIILYYKTKIIKMYKGGIEIKNINFGKIKIGFPYMSYPGLPTTIKIEGKCIFGGKASIPLECDLNIVGKLYIGNNFTCSQGTKIDAKENSYIGEDVLVGHKCYFTDDDGHKVYKKGIRVNEKKGYYIDNHVWLSRGVSVLKGAKVAKGSLVAAGSIVTKNHLEENVILAGIPAEVVKKEIEWER